MSQSDKRAAVEMAWPLLPTSAWQDTYQTLHMWTQVAGKVRLALSPHVNHWWQVPLYVTPRGLSTSAIPYGHMTFEVRFDLLGHELVVETSEGVSKRFSLAAYSVAEFYRKFFETLRDSGIEVRIWKMPVEIPDPIAFDRDTVHASYDADAAHKFWRILVSVDEVLKEFRGRFLGKCSPVHFFWGSFDHCVTRFSGKRAPERPDADRITKEAYSHEVISAGFWPGSGEVKDAAFYCYVAPEPEGFAAARVRPKEAYYHAGLKEYILMYEDVRRADSPKEALMQFLESTYTAAAELARWDRASLERQNEPAA